MGWIDSMIGWVSPRAACEREAWRQQLQIMRNYDAASNGRLNAGWRESNEAADLTDRYARDTIRARARDLERNSDIANSVIFAFKRNVVGKGYMLQARTDDANINEQLMKLWKKWTKKVNCDVTCQQSFNQMIRMAVERKKIDGGIIFLKCYTKDGIIPFKLQTLEVDELDTTQIQTHAPGNKVVGGIEYNTFGKPVGYWIRQYAIDGWEITEPQYKEAGNIIFYFSKKRPSQLREISDMAQTLTRVRDINEYITAVSVKERIAACLSVFIKKAYPTGINPGRNSQASTNGQKSYDGKTISPGMIMEMNPGDETEVVNPGAGASEATEFLKTQERLIGAGQGLSYEAVSRDLTGTTYSSARQGAIEDEISYTEEVELLQEVMSEIYETFVISAVMSRAIVIPNFWEDKDNYLQHEWVATPKKWIDPYKESNANKIAMESGQKTYKQIAAEQGKDWKQQLDDMADVQDYANEKGITINTGKTVPGKNSGGTESGKTETE